uniref:Putative conserved secreted protein n=1 Tax=Ornithodoros turicata TaxID=34597 RepID=A0A2R5LGI5_9ACAR
MQAVLVVFHLVILCVLHDCAMGSYRPCTDIEGWRYELPPARHGRDSDGCERAIHKAHHGSPEKNAQGQLVVKAFLKSCSYWCQMPYLPNAEKWKKRNEPDWTPCANGPYGRGHRERGTYLVFGKCQHGECQHGK